MKNSFPHYAFIDSQNLYMGVKKQGWTIDFARFRTHLKDKYKVGKAYLFMGYIQGNQQIYKKLQEDGFVLVYKPTLTYKDGSTKGNCDAELVLHAMIEYQNYKKAVLVSGDGDFFCLAEYLRDTGKLKAVIVPNQKKYSALFNRINTDSEKFLVFINNIQSKVEYTGGIKKAP